MRKELLYNFIFTFFTSVIIFVQNKYFVQYMGVEILGIMKLFTQLLKYLNIVELGLGSASTFALYRPLIEKDQEQLSIIMSTLKNTYSKISIFILCLGILITPFLPFFIKLENFRSEIYIYWIFYVLSTVSTYLYIKYVILFTANQELIYTRFVQSASKIIFQILQIIIIVKYHSFFLFILLLILDNLGQYIIFKIHYRKYYFYITYTKKKYQGLNKDIKNLFWHKIGGLVVFNTDLILISKLTSIDIVGIYASYTMIFQILKTIGNIIYSVLNPKIGKYIAQNNNEKIYMNFKKMNIVFILGGLLLIFPTLKLINSFIRLWIGKDFILENLTIVLMCINYYIDLVRWVLEAYKSGAGFFDDVQSPILESTINLVFSIILGIKYGLNGIIMGTIISNVTVILIYKPILVFKRCFDKDIKEYIKVYGNYLILLAISLFCLNIVTKPFIRTDINSWLDWIIYATIISIITGVVLFVVFLLNKDFRNMIKIYVLKKNN